MDRLGQGWLRGWTPKEGAGPLTRTGLCFSTEVAVLGLDYAILGCGMMESAGSAAASLAAQH